MSHGIPVWLSGEDLLKMEIDCAILMIPPLTEKKNAFSSCSLCM